MVVKYKRLFVQYKAILLNTSIKDGYFAQIFGENNTSQIIMRHVLFINPYHFSYTLSQYGDRVTA